MQKMAFTKRSDLRWETLWEACMMILDLRRLGIKWFEMTNIRVQQDSSFVYCVYLFLTAMLHELNFYQLHVGSCGSTEPQIVGGRVPRI